MAQTRVNVLPELPLLEARLDAPSQRLPDQQVEERCFLVSHMVVILVMVRTTAVCKLWRSKLSLDNCAFFSCTATRDAGCNATSACWCTYDKRLTQAQSMLLSMSVNVLASLSIVCCHGRSHVT